MHTPINVFGIFMLRLKLEKAYEKKKFFSKINAPSTIIDIPLNKTIKAINLSRLYFITKPC